MISFNCFGLRNILFIQAFVHKCDLLLSIYQENQNISISHQLGNNLIFFVASIQFIIGISMSIIIYLNFSIVAILTASSQLLAKLILNQRDSQVSFIISHNNASSSTTNNFGFSTMSFTSSVFIVRFKKILG